MFLCATLSLSVFAVNKSNNPMPQVTVNNSDSVPPDTAPPNPDTTTGDTSMEGTSLKTQFEETSIADSAESAASGWGGMNGGEAPATIEAGVLIGEPMAISGKYWLNNRVGIDAGVGWSFSESGKLDVLGDILLHPYYIPVNFGDLPTYLGAGVTFRVGDGDSFLGVRFPVGAELLASGFPITIFAEIVPVMEVVPDMGFRMAGGGGIRFAFGR
jgi:hypothetical protein